MLAAVTSSIIDYFPHVAGIAVINIKNHHQQQPQQRHAIERALNRCPKKNSLLRANAAQQRHNVGFVFVHFPFGSKITDGPVEGGLSVTAGRQVRGKHGNNTTQNQ